jgi:hypothetical protein
MRSELVQVLREPDVDDGVADYVVRRFWTGVGRGAAANKTVASPRSGGPKHARVNTNEGRTIDLARWAAARGVR